VSYLFHAFLFSADPPSAADARQYLLEGALFDTRPDISIRCTPAGRFEEMTLRYDPNRRPMILRRLSGEDAEANQAEAIEAASTAGRPDIADASPTPGW
jgi:hypothetical protein